MALLRVLGSSFCIHCRQGLGLEDWEIGTLKLSKLETFELEELSRSKFYAREAFRARSPATRRVWCHIRLVLLSGALNPLECRLVLKPAPKSQSSFKSLSSSSKLLQMRVSENRDPKIDPRNRKIPLQEGPPTRYP